MSISYYNYLSWEAVNGCLDILELSPLMDSVILDTLLYKNLSADSLKEVGLIDPGFIHDLCVKYGTKGVISLDEISLFDTLEIRPLFVRSEEIENTRGIIANEKVWPGTQWRVYSDSGLVLVDYTFNDTLAWQGIDINEEYAVNKLPLLIDMLPMALQYSGETFGKLIAPYWTEVKRVYYTSGSSEMKKAAKLASKNDWLAAATIWNAQSTDHNPVLAAYAAFNMALSCEVMDKIDLAMVWINKSWELNESEVTRMYADILLKRKRNKNKISRQFDGIEHK